MHKGLGNEIVYGLFNIFLIMNEYISILKCMTINLQIDEVLIQEALALSNKQSEIYVVE